MRVVGATPGACPMLGTTGRKGTQEAQNRENPCSGDSSGDSLEDEEAEWGLEKPGQS